MAERIKVTVWNEGRHEKSNPAVREVYPDGIHAVIKGFLSLNEDMDVRTATLDDPDHGLTDEVLNGTDVLLWWGHLAHGEVRDDIVQKIYDRVQNGMGFIALHSAHGSKAFAKLCGTNSWELNWREADDRSIIWPLEPNHPIAKGIGKFINLEAEEMYGEPFGIPKPDELVFISWFEGGEVFRSGCCYYRGNGRIFYFQPGHETYRSFYVPDVQTVITNAVRWANAGTRFRETGPREPINPIKSKQTAL